MFDLLSDGLKLFLQIGQTVALLYAAYVFTRKPHDTLSDRITTLEVEQKEMKQSLLHGNDKFRHQAKTNKMFKAVMLAFVDFEIAYCHNTGYKDNTDLLRARQLLQDFLSEDDHEEC